MPPKEEKKEAKKQTAKASEAPAKQAKSAPSKAASAPAKEPAKKAAAPASKTTTAPVKETAPAPAKETTPVAKTTTAPPAAKKDVAPKTGTAKPVPETLLKKRRTRDSAKMELEKKRADTKKKLRTTRRVIFKRAEKYIKEYRNMEQSLIRFRRQAKQGGNFYVEPEAKLAFVIRIRGTMGLHPKPRKILTLLRLRQVNSGVFVRLTKATKQMLTLVEPYITYGYPNLKSVRELIYKRGFAKVDKQRTAITHNQVIENKLGKHDILCIEDLVHEIFTVGSHFKQANKFLWPFKLSCPNGGWVKTLNHYNEGGDSGNREDKINQVIHKMI